MHKLSSYIGKLLYDHNCVVIPGFGAVIGNYRPARLDSDKKIIKPPSKKLAFNQLITENDGLLINHVAKKEHVSLSTAEEMVNDFSESIKHHLEKAGEVRLRGIGKLFFDEEKKLLFKPYDRINYLRESYQLYDVKVEPLYKKRVMSQAQNISQTIMEMSTEKKSTSRGPVKSSQQKKPANKKNIYIVLPSILFVLAVVSGLILMNDVGVDSGLDHAGMGPDLSTEVTDFQETESNEDIILSDEEDLMKAEAVEEFEDDDAISQSNGRFHIIVGSFVDYDNALKLKQKIDGFSKVLDPTGGGKIRVSVGQYESFNDALIDIENKRSQFGSDAWILKQ